LGIGICFLCGLAWLVLNFLISPVCALQALQVKFYVALGSVRAFCFNEVSMPHVGVGMMFGAARLVCAFRSFEGGLHVMCGPSWLACVLSDLEGLGFGWVRTFRGKYVEAQISKSGLALRPARVLRGWYHWYAPFGLSLVVW
jgi:hypothetical protein